MAKRRSRKREKESYEWMWSPAATTEEISAGVRALAQSLPWLLVARNRPSIPADASAVEHRIPLGKPFGLMPRPTTITRRLLSVFHPKPLFYLLQVDSRSASKRQRRRHSLAEDPVALEADHARLLWEANRWIEIAKLAMQIRRRLGESAPPDRAEHSYYFISFGVAGWEVPHVSGGKLVPVEIGIEEVVSKLARDAQSQAKRAAEYVGEIKPRLRAARTDTKAARIAYERLAILHCIMRAGIPEWTFGDTADALMTSCKDWNGENASGERVGQPCPGIVSQYLYDPEQSPRVLAADDRRSKLISWIEKNVRRRGS